MNRILLFLLVLPFLAISCSEGNTENSDIVGTWVRESITPCEVVTDNTEATNFIYADVRSYDSDVKDSYIFSENGRVLFLDSVYTDESLYQIQDTTITFAYPNGENVVVPIFIADNTFSLFTDETEYYQKWIDFVFPTKEIEVSKVITRYTYLKTK